MLVFSDSEALDGCAVYAAVCRASLYSILVCGHGRWIPFVVSATNRNCTSDLSTWALGRLIEENTHNSPGLLSKILPSILLHLHVCQFIS